MAQHKDIDRASALLEGVQGWHIEYHPESISNDDKETPWLSRISKILCIVLYLSSIAVCRSLSESSPIFMS